MAGYALRVVCSLTFLGSSACQGSEPADSWVHELAWDMDDATNPVDRVEPDEITRLALAQPDDPSVLLDVRSPGELVTHVSYAALLPGGGFAVADEYDLRVFVLSESGEVEHAWGRSGEGPGEFLSIRWMGVDGDGRIVVWDRSRSRMTAWSREGVLLDEGRVPPWITQLAGSPTGTIADGGVVFVQPRRPDFDALEPGEPYGTEQEVRLWDWHERDEAQRPPEAVVAGRPQELHVEREGGRRTRVGESLLFTAGTLVVGDGYHLVLLNTGTARARVIDVRSPDESRLVELNVGGDEPAPVGEDEVERERAALLAGTGSGSRVPGVLGARRNAIKGVSAPPVRPLLGTLRMGSGPGKVLVAEYRATFEQVSTSEATVWCEWSLHSVSVEACVDLPSNLELIGLRNGRALAIEWFETGLQRLLRFETRPPS